MNELRFSGLLAPVITPFNKDLSANAEKLARHCRWLLDQGAGLAVFGTNSEANSLGTDEKITLLSQLIEAGIPAAEMMPGTGSCALTDSVKLTLHAVKAGCRGVLMLPPFYYKGVSDDGLFASYAEIIQRVADPKLQIYLYHIPQVTGVPLSLQLIERLVKEFPGTIAGIKDSSGDWKNTLAILQSRFDDFRVFCGSESFLLATLRNGGAGCISATANVNPAAIRRLYDNWQAANAEQLQSQLNDVRLIFQSMPMISGLKSATAQFSNDPDWLRVRPPLTPLAGAQQTQLAAQLAAVKFTMPGLNAQP